MASGKQIITILSLALLLVIAIQVLLHGGISLSDVQRTILELTVTNKDVTVRVPYADVPAFLYSLG
jgi:hypothetical protein